MVGYLLVTWVAVQTVLGGVGLGSHAGEVHIGPVFRIEVPDLPIQDYCTSPYAPAWDQVLCDHLGGSAEPPAPQPGSADDGLLRLVVPAEGAALPTTPADLALDLDGSLVEVGYDPGDAPALGDDVVVVREGLRAAALRWADAPVAAGLELALRGAAVPLVGVPATPVGQLGPEGLQLDAAPEATPQPLHVWTASWWGEGWGTSASALRLPAAFVASSDVMVARASTTATLACTGAAHTAQLDTACPAAWALYDGLAPGIDIAAELQDARVDLAPASAAAHAEGGGTTASVGQGFGLAKVAQDEASGVSEAMPPPDSAPARPGATSGTSATAIPAESVASRAKAGSDAGPAIPLALAGLALLAPAWALYRRILPKRALDHPSRAAIVAHVQAAPGVRTCDVAKALGLAAETMNHHVRTLEDFGLLEQRAYGGRRCLFLVGQADRHEKPLLAAAAGPSARVLQAVHANPGVTQTALAEQLGLAISTVKWHLDRLAEVGAVTVQHEGRVKRVAPAAPLAPSAMAEAAALA